MPKFGYYMPRFVFAGVFTLIGGALMTTVTTSTSTSAIYGYSVLIAMGGGSTSQAAYSIAPAKVGMTAPQHIPAAIAFVNIAQIGAIVIALTVSGTIYQNLAYDLLGNALGRFGYTSAQLHDIVTGAGSEVFASLPPDRQVMALRRLSLRLGGFTIWSWWRGRWGWWGVCF